MNNATEAGTEMRYRDMTAEDYLVAQDLPPYTELVHGNVVEMTPPSGRHGQVCNRIAYLLTRHAEDHQSGHVLVNDAGVQTARQPDTVRGADVAYLSFERQPAGRLPDDYSFATPEVIFEVLSKTDRWASVYTKVGEYLASSVEVVIVVEPELETLRCFREDGSVVLLTNKDMLVVPEIRPTFERNVVDFF